MRKPIVAGNWKMNLTPCEAEALAKALVAPTKSLKDIDIVICPSFPFLSDVVRTVVGTNIQVGSQDASWEEKGAFTGEVSPHMLESLVSHCIIGHSERRKKLNETNGMINWKLVNVLKYSLTPILCVGEDADTRSAGNTESFVKNQLEESLRTIDLESVEDFSIAYEPIWAIGTGTAATPEDAQQGCAFIRETLNSLYSDAVSNKVRVLYGGSVNAKNATHLYAGNDIDGFLVGGASLQVEEFTAICIAAAKK